MEKLRTIKTYQIALLLALIILITPYLFTQFSIVDFTNTGNIGDTLGGITAPFISSIAAVLVFIAFKAQLEANNLFYEAERTRSILEQIFDLDDKSGTYQLTIHQINSHTTTLHKSVINDVFLSKIDLTKYLLSSILLTYAQLKKLPYGDQKDFLKSKLNLLYRIKFSRDIDQLIDYSHKYQSSILSIYKDRINEIEKLVHKIHEELSITPPTKISVH